jgi:hypothetical protein
LKSKQNKNGKERKLNKKKTKTEKREKELHWGRPTISVLLRVSSFKKWIKDLHSSCSFWQKLVKSSIF